MQSHLIYNTSVVKPFNVCGLKPLMETSLQTNMVILDAVTILLPYLEKVT